VRTRYFRDNAFGDDGGYAKKWVSVQLGPLPLGFPNSAARVRAVKYHDLHHVVTGYATDLVGEPRSARGRSEAAARDSWRPGS